MNIIETKLDFKLLNYRKLTRRIILHHSACNKCSAEDIHRWHLNNGWAGAGYHFLIRKDGSIYRLRSEKAVGAHAYGSNYDSVGICFEGNFMEEQVTEEQIKSGKELVAFLKEKYGISKVQAHRDVCRTSCPGNNFAFEVIANGEVTEIEKPEIEIESGDKEIREIQHLLNEKYNANIDEDGYYGNETKMALVKALQTELNIQFHKGLKVDGYFGKNTYNACVNVRKGAEGNITWLIQAMLKCKDKFDFKVDAKFGDHTYKAVVEFQLRNDLLGDGIVGKDTFNKLFK